MIIWRISNYADISGVGGLKFAARWHNRGAAIVYTAEHPALAMLEILVHSDRSYLPDGYKLIGISVPNGMKVHSASDLKTGWQSNEGYTRTFGDKWLLDRQSAILRVPSVIMPHTFNYLINPTHPEAAEIRISKAEIHSLDIRLR